MTVTQPDPDHTETETHTWSVNIPDHPTRTDSPEYVAARKKMNDLAAQSTGLLYGPGPFDDHHGSALWLQDSQGWFLVRNLAGIEWSAQFCAEPAKVDLLRQNAKRLYDLVAPQIKQQLDPNGLLDTPIQDAAGVASWTDSIFNAGLPLHASFHVGVLTSAGQPPTPPGNGQGQDLAAPGQAQNPPAASPPQPVEDDPEPAGVHHYPTPVVDIQLFKFDDFQLWVTDDEGNPAAVAPVAARGSGDARVHVLYATPGSQLAAQKRQAESAATPLILGPEHPMAKQAFQNQ
jgi:Family of unknown function (DUF6424)